MVSLDVEGASLDELDDPDPGAEVFGFGCPELEPEGTEIYPEEDRLECAVVERYDKEMSLKLWMSEVSTRSSLTTDDVVVSSWSLLFGLTPCQ